MAVISLYLVFFVVLPAIILIAHRSSRCRRLRLPPGSLGLPFVGETLQLISAYKTENPEPFIDERVSRFGSLFTTHVFGEPTVFSVDPETNRFIMQNEGKLFECSYPGSISNLLGKHSLLLMKGSLHKRMHSLTMSFANSSIIRDHLLVDIDRLIRLNLDSWSDRVLLMEEAKKITFELTMKQLMSFDPCEWTESLRKEYVLVIEGFFSVPLPIFSPTYRRAIKARTKVAEALSLVVKQRRIESESGEKRKDMLAALVASDDHGSFSDEQIVDFLVALLVAGYETTSTSMTLAVKFLTETPLALAQITVGTSTAGCSPGIIGKRSALISRKKKKSNQSVVSSCTCCSTGYPLSCKLDSSDFSVPLVGSMAREDTHMIMVPCRGALPFMLLATFWFNCIKLGSLKFLSNLDKTCQ
ncbi:cytochrome P450 90A1 [Populus alba x Populus x berolinensis]|nr:cytochrome P450 90A1 [Populus alba x Populus x berolinensis]